MIFGFLETRSSFKVWPILRSPLVTSRRRRGETFFLVRICVNTRNSIRMQSFIVAHVKFPFVALDFVRISFRTAAHGPQSCHVSHVDNATFHFLSRHRTRKCALFVRYGHVSCFLRTNYKPKNKPIFLRIPVLPRKETKRMNTSINDISHGNSIP